MTILLLNTRRKMWWRLLSLPQNHCDSFSKLKSQHPRPRDHRLRKDLFSLSQNLLDVMYQWFADIKIRNKSMVCYRNYFNSFTSLKWWLHNLRSWGLCPRPWTENILMIKFQTAITFEEVLIINRNFNIVSESTHY